MFTGDAPLAARHLQSFSRNGVNIVRNDWVLVTTTDNTTVVGRIGEMLELHVNVNKRVTAVVRVLLEHVSVPAFDAFDMVKVSIDSEDHCMYVPVESAHISYLCRDLVDGEMWLRFRERKCVTY